MFTRSIRFISIALLLALGATALEPVQPAYAAGYLVNTLADTNQAKDGFCSLREAIFAADNIGNGDCGPNSPNGDVINFLVAGKIRLGSTLPNVVAGQGTLNINGANKITVSGDTNNDGTGDVRVMYVEPGADLALANITVELGSAGAASGGAAANLGSMLVVNSTFSQNSAGSDGGAISNDGKLTTINTAFVNNSAVGAAGGGIANTARGSLFIVHSTFTGNHADHGGGGIANFGTATIGSSTFSNNSASIPFGNGGGILSGRGSLSIYRSTFSNNVADAGAGIYVDTAQVLVENSTLSLNHADRNGGGIANSGGTLRIERSTFSGNTADNAGGGISNEIGFWGDPAKLIVTRSTFRENTAAGGGGLYSVSYTQIYNSTFADNTASSGNGGGIEYLPTTAVAMVLSYNTLSGNSADLGGGIFVATGDPSGATGTTYIDDTIVANSPSGGNCSGTFFWQFDNLATDFTCAGFAYVTSAQLNFGALTGAPAYFPLNAGSVAIDLGDNLLCSAAWVVNQSQNGVARPQDGNGDGTAICDVGSYEAPGMR